MYVVKAIQFRDHLKNYCDKAADGETIFVSRKDNQNVVVISEEKYNRMKKALNNEEYRSMLRQSLKGLEESGIRLKDLPAGDIDAQAEIIIDQVAECQ